MVAIFPLLLGAMLVPVKSETSSNNGPFNEAVEGGGGKVNGSIGAWRVRMG